jgi:hypothetical protein
MKRRLLGAVTFTAAACTPAPEPREDAGAHDAGRSDAGTDAGYGADAGCPCVTDAGVCKVPADFPATEPSYVRDDICDCTPNNAVVFCYFETAARCANWACRPGKTADGGLSRLSDGGVDCLCFA